MSGSLTNLFYHFVFSTKGRHPLIEPSWTDELYAYISAILLRHGCFLLSGGGVADHIHLLVRMSPAVSVSHIIREVKAGSSSWARQRRRAAGRFRWQAGYGAFTVSRSELQEVRAYIANQETHHRRFDFRNEFVSLLRQHGIEHDERYLWG